MCRSVTVRVQAAADPERPERRVLASATENVGGGRAVLAVVADAGLGVKEPAQLAARLVLRGQRVVGSPPGRACRAADRRIAARSRTPAPRANTRPVRSTSGPGRGGRPPNSGRPRAPRRMLLARRRSRPTRGPRVPRFNAASAGPAAASRARAPDSAPTPAARPRTPVPPAGTSAAPRPCTATVIARGLRTARSPPGRG